MTEKKYCGCSESAMNGFCRRLNASTRCALCSSSRQLLIARDSVLRVIDIPHEVAIVKSGAIASVISTPNGRSQAVFLAGSGYVGNVIRVAGDSLSYGVDFNDSHEAYAFTDARICAISLDVVRRMFREDADFAWAILSSLTDRYKDTLKATELMAENSGVEKVIYVLDVLEEAGVNLDVVTHKTIGKMLNMSRVSVSRLMQQALEMRENR